MRRSTNHNPNGNNNLVADCREGLARIPRVKIQHCYREANNVFDSPPADVALLLSLNNVGILYERSIAPASVV